MPRVGVCLPARNVLRYIETGLTTVAAQTYAYTNCYIADDASDDGTYEFLAARSTWYTRLIRNPTRRGWPGTLNAAAAMAVQDGCELLFIMNADDFLRLDCIDKCYAEMRSGGFDAVTAYTQQLGGENVKQVPLCEFPITLEKLSGQWCPIPNQALITTAAWQQVQGYSLDVTPPGCWGYTEDWDFWIKFVKAGYNIGIVREPVYYYLMHPGQLHEDGVGRHEEARNLTLGKHGLL
jgi:GT2 family glycosyltransferase